MLLLLVIIIILIITITTTINITTTTITTTTTTTTIEFLQSKLVDLVPDHDNDVGGITGALLNMFTGVKDDDVTRPLDIDIYPTEAVVYSKKDISL